MLLFYRGTITCPNRWEEEKGGGGLEFLQNLWGAPVAIRICSENVLALTKNTRSVSGLNFPVA